MATFFSDWESCMRQHGMPVPHVEDADEALELLHQLHSAAENAGILEPDQVVTIGTLLAAGGLSQVVSEPALIVLAGVAQTAAVVYINQGVACVFAVAALDIKRLFASNDLPDFVSVALAEQGIDLAAAIA
jgi:hypothetical protein